MGASTSVAYFAGAGSFAFYSDDPAQHFLQILDNHIRNFFLPSYSYSQRSLKTERRLNVARLRRAHPNDGVEHV
jgi:hypothetical protein